MKKPLMRWIAFFVLSSFNVINADTIYVIPFQNVSEEAFLYDREEYDGEVHNRWFLLRGELEGAGYQVKALGDHQDLEDVAAIISFNGVEIEILQKLSKFPKSKRWLICFEPPVVMPSLYQRFLSAYFGKIFVMFDDLIDRKTYQKFCYPQPRLHKVSDIPSFSDKFFCCLINGNKVFYHPSELYSERRAAAQFFSSCCPEGEFDLFGAGWLGSQAWKGPFSASKFDLVKQYKFCICYENMKDQNGYITEKIFDCLVGGCVPVYWGADNIAEYIPKECFIDRRQFGSNEDLYKYLKSIDEQTYARFLDAAEFFLGSEQAQRFSIKSFANVFLNALRKH